MRNLTNFLGMTAHHPTEKLFFIQSNLNRLCYASKISGLGKNINGTSL
jgi:hypothetical protein